MTYTQVVRFFGTQAQAAKSLGFSRQAVNQWKADGIKPRTQELIQFKTQGKLKADGGK